MRQLKDIWKFLWQRVLWEVIKWLWNNPTTGAGMLGLAWGVAKWGYQTLGYVWRGMAWLDKILAIGVAALGFFTLVLLVKSLFNYLVKPQYKPQLITEGAMGGNMRLTDGMVAQTVLVRNVQRAKATKLVSAKTKLEYDHPDEHGRVVEPGGWLPEYGTLPMAYSTSVDIKSGIAYNAIYLMRSDGCCHFPGPGNLQMGAKVDEGEWRVIVSVSSANCKQFQFGIAFYVGSEGRLIVHGVLRKSRNFSKWLTGKRDNLSNMAMSGHLSQT